MTAADRRSNERAVKELQRKLFDRTGLFLERKRGEFEDGIREGYIPETEIIDRTQLFRAALTVHGKLNQAIMRKLGAVVDYAELVNVSDDLLDRYAFAILLLDKLTRRKKNVTARVSGFLLTKLYFGLAIGFSPGMTFKEREETIGELAQTLEHSWMMFERLMAGKLPRPSSNKHVRAVDLGVERYLNSVAFKNDLDRFRQRAALDPGGPTSGGLTLV